MISLANNSVYDWKSLYVNAILKHRNIDGGIFSSIIQKGLKISWEAAYLIGLYIFKSIIMKYYASTETTIPECIATGMELNLASFDVGHIK